jgi:pilus assembly protein FimV
MVKSLDEVEDLTRFANESFDTDDIDLFEFTGNDDSPLTRLKSVILSLEWEINNDILDELLGEIENLRGIWDDDKVVQIYLQGLDKIGKYMKAEGAYAHHNAIKLLLTLFYNFEKIISSPDISGDTITTLLKSDIRKFKVLQYQIGKKKSPADQPKDIIIDVGVSEPTSQLLAKIEASILGLDWEITDNGLEEFNRQAAALRSDFNGNNHAQVLIQGLQTIGSYIQEEKINAHPDAFTLLHTFFDSLKTLVTAKNLNNEQYALFLEYLSGKFSHRKYTGHEMLEKLELERQFSNYKKYLNFLNIYNYYSKRDLINIINKGEGYKWRIPVQK